MTLDIQLKAGQHIHIIGIGGTGMSAIARILVRREFKVSGSDLSSNTQTEELSNLGAIVYKGHEADYVNGADMVFRSSAIKDNHVEVVSAREQHITVYKRYDVLSALLAGYQTIAIAGTHGKTTTTSMVAHTLYKTDRQPSYIIGGALTTTGLNADVGAGQHFVIEADEYDNMFHGLQPDIAVVTGVEFDHPDFFKTPDDMTQSFAHFVSLLSNDGLLICCADNVISLDFAQNRREQSLPTLTYGIDTPADWQATNIRYQNGQTLYDIVINGENQGTVILNVPGRHNILNSMVALIVAHQDGVPFADAIEAMASFRGASRRFDIRAEIDNIIIVDDYAHHPTAIDTTIDATRQRYPDHQLWAIWQPHTFTRTQTLWDDYLQVFDEAHHIIVTDIFASREKAEDYPAVTSEMFISALQHPDKHHIADFNAIVQFLLDNVQSPAVILIMSAGDAPQIGKDYAQQLEEKQS